jgi:hypothetical protein
MSYSSAIGRFDAGYSQIGSTPSPTAPDVERLYDNIQALMPAVTLPVIEMELWNTVCEFCIRSTYYRSKIYWEMAPGVSTVDFNPFDVNTLVTWVLHVDGLTRWEINPPAMLVDLYPPTASRSGWAIVSLRPKGFDEVKLNALPELFTTWFETMLDGTMFRLYGMPVKPWSSPQLAQYHGTRFRQGINRARDIAERLHSSQQSPSRRYPYFAAGRRKN